MLPMPGTPPPGGGAEGMLAGMMARSPIMPAAGPPQLRPVPGSEDDGTAFYDQLAQGDRAAEEKVRKLFKLTREASLEGREQIEAGWWQKLLYINGRQWIFHNPRNGWQDKRMARWIPRPVTNICAETMQTIRAMLTGIEVSARSRPTGPDPLNTVTAKVADDIEPTLREEHDMQNVFFEADFWAPALGAVWLHLFWDKDSTKNQEFIPAMACPTCQYQVHPLDLEDGIVPGCPECGAPGEVFAPAEQDGKPVGKLETIGSGVTEPVSPLEILIPMYVQRWGDCTELIRLRWRPKSYYEGRPYAEKINYRSTPADRSLQMYRALATMTDLTTSPLQGSTSTSTQMEGAIEAELWVKPCKLYPKGLWARFVGGSQGDTLMLRDEERGVMPGPIPTLDIHDRPMWPWVYYPFELRGGKLFGVSLLEPMIQKQDQINRADSMVELIMQRMANPIWLEPKGAEVQRFTGEPGLIVRYSVVAGSNAKPERIEGTTGSVSTFQALRAQYLADAEKAAGTQDVLKGSNPSGISAFSALNLLVERSQSRFTSLFKARGRAYREWFKMALELERVHGPQTRVRTVIGKNNTYQFKVFQKEDLRGSIDIIVEDGSEQPKTALGKRAALQQAKELGFVNAEDPGTIYKGLDLLGIADIAPGLSVHTTSADVEQHQYEQWVAGGRQGKNPMKVESWQDHKIHVLRFDLWANTDRMRALSLNDPLVQIELTQHRLMHSIASVNPFGLPMAQNQIAPPGAPGAPGAPPPAPGGELPPPGGPPPQGAAMAMANSAQESGAIDTLPGAAPGGGNMDAPA